MSAPETWTPDQIAAASVAEIAAGRLPLQAQWRIAAMRKALDEGKPGAFTSALSTNEFAAIRSVGFSPAGQVMGSAVFNVGWSYTGCGYAFAYGGYGAGPYGTRAPYGGGGFNSGGFSGQGMGGGANPRGTYGGVYGGARYGGTGFGGWSPSPVVDVPSIRDLLEQARHRALERMREECAGIRGDGVVGVQLTVRPFYDNGLEFMAIGTAVRADGAKRPKRPFTSDLSGQDFAKVMRAGWVPVDLVQGVGAVVRHDDYSQLIAQRSWSNQELQGLTNLVNAARQSARTSLEKDAARRGADSVVLRDITLNVFESRCLSGAGDDAHDHIAESFLWGTALVPVHSGGRPPQVPAPLPMLRLDAQPPATPSANARTNGRRNR